MTFYSTGIQQIYFFYFLYYQSISGKKHWKGCYFCQMPTSIFVNQNGKVIREDAASISINNRSFRYGDGCFETMKMIDDKLLLSDYHFERLFSSLSLLQFDIPNHLTPNYLQEQVLYLAKKNCHNKLARIRLMAYRGDGGLYDPQNHFPNYLIQTWELNPAVYNLNENGLVTDIFEDAVKPCDKYSAIKSNNYLGYAMAALWARQQHLNDAILLNPYGRVADATIANVFMVKDGIVKTPPLDEGGINGIMRRHLLSTLPTIGIEAQETPLTVEDLLQADELFLTNSISGIRWVKRLREREYGNDLAAMVFRKVVSNKL